MLASLRAVLSHRWSITGRLARHYFLSSALLLLLVGALLYLGLSRSLFAQDRALIASKARVLRVLLEQNQANLLALRSEVEHEAGEEGGLRYFLRVLAADGRTLLETPGMAPVLPPAAFAGLGADAEPRTLASGVRYLLATERLRDGRQLHLALDMEHNYEVLDAYRRQLVVVVLGGVLVAGLAGAVIARRGLRPLAHITRAAQHVTASHLQARVSATTWPAELEALAREFDRMLDRLEDSFRRLSQCTGDMAHALRNPINNLRGEAEVALARARSPEEYQHALASSLEEYDRLARLIDALLFIARADEATTAVERRAFAVRAEMEAVREFYDALAADKEVVVECAGAAAIHGDPMLFRRAVSNLLANALKHTGRGGRIVLHAATQPDGSAEITVTDNGPGIAASHLPRIFERFYQVNKSRDQTAEGAGLGLAIVRSIMRLHGGEARVESEPGRGSKFTLLFPAGPGMARAH